MRITDFQSRITGTVVSLQMAHGGDKRGYLQQMEMLKKKMAQKQYTLAEKVARYKFRPMRSYDVYITKIFFPSNFYVRLGFISQNDLNSLEVCGRPLKKDDLKINKMVCYYSKTLGKMVRGRICKIYPHQTNPKYMVHAIDYGFYDDMVPFLKIFDRGGDTSVPALAFLCQLAQCFPVGGSPWGQGSSDAMRNFIGESMVRLHVRIQLENRLIVGVSTKVTQVDVVQWLISNRFAVSHFPNENEKPHPTSGYKEYTFRDLEEGDVMMVRVQTAGSVEDFYVARLDDYAEYLADREDFTRYCDEQEDMLPTDVLQGRAVGYKCPYEETFYERACILEAKSNGNRAIIQLLDWGDKVDVKHTELKKVEYMKLRERPAVAIYCSTIESEAWNNRLHQYLCPGFECVVTVKRVGDEFSVPHLIEVNKRA